MSTKIYNGFRFKTADLFVIHGTLADFRERIRPLVAGRFVGWIASECVEYLDDVTTGALNPEELSSPAGHAHGKYWDKRKSVKQGYREPEIDMEFSITILPYMGGAGREVYGIVFTEHEDWRDMWFAEPLVQEFAYQNSTDWRPKGVSGRAFEERGRVWDLVLGDNPPSARGMTAELVPDYLPWPELEDVVSAIVRDWPLERRAKRVAKNALIETRARTERGDDEWANHQFMRSFHDTMDWLKTPEGIEARAKLADEMKSRLVADITSDVLRATHGEVPA